MEDGGMGGIEGELDGRVGLHAQLDGL
jgi:hypothetical protein